MRKIKKHQMTLIRWYFLCLSFLLGILFLCNACTLDNTGDGGDQQIKTDYSNYNYVLATEDAFTPDITRFFSFNLADMIADKTYDLIDDNQWFRNSDPSTSSGHQFFGNYIFSLAKDKKGYSSTPGIFRLTLNSQNSLFIDQELNVNKDNLFPSRKLCIVNAHTGFFYNEGLAAQTIQVFDPTAMKLKGSIDLKPFIEQFRPQARFADEYGNNLVRTGSLVLDYKEDKLYVSIVFLEKASFNLIAEDEQNFYTAVIDIPSLRFEKIISYPYAKTVGFFVSENHATAKDEKGDLYFCSWGWNQFYNHQASRVFRIKRGDTNFDLDWQIDIEKHFGKGRIAQSITAFNNKLYLHISQDIYRFDSSEDNSTKNTLEMGYYEFDPAHPDKYKKLDIPFSNPSSRMSVFTVVDQQLYICVPNSVAPKFNGIYVLNKQGILKPVLKIASKYRPTRFYKLGMQ